MTTKASKQALRKDTHHEFALIGSDVSVEVEYTDAGIITRIKCGDDLLNETTTLVKE